MLTSQNKNAMLIIEQPTFKNALIENCKNEKILQFFKTGFRIKILTYKSMNAGFLKLENCTNRGPPQTIDLLAKLDGLVSII
ncbi:conserved hypothetical protein [Trichinella spiralis]|uniref:hypothetical protein n=1 Tax=Trichinella spiralis TaxID=6334 RepID=UPI0001EFCFD2|nr:conserved hypothetical protein [Trichinella spiralis]